MENIIFYGRKQNTDSREHIIDYYLIEESIGEKYTDMMCYGIRIVDTAIYHGGGKTIDMKQLNNIFYKYSDADTFIRQMMKDGVLPEELKKRVEDYIVESIRV